MAYIRHNGPSFRGAPAVDTISQTTFTCVVLGNRRGVTLSKAMR